MAQHAVVFFYIGTARYYFLTWFLTMLVVMVFVSEVGIDWLRSRFPNVSAHLGRLPSVRWLGSGLAWLEQTE
jgi:hypothetical protein